MRVCVINVVGLTPALLPHAPRLRALGPARAWGSPIPAVTLTSQATLMTGVSPRRHGVVGNGWLYRETQEVRFWQQTYSLLRHPTWYDDLAGKSCFQVFWWFALGAPVAGMITPRPFYGCDGSKELAVLDTTGCQLETALGRFPFPAFWGPMAGLASSEWISRAAARVLQERRPDLTLVYLPHLDYDHQRVGPGDPEPVREVDACAGHIIDAAQATDTAIVVVSEYGVQPVRRPVYINRALREQGWLKVRPGAFGEVFQAHSSQAFAAADHQLAHVYVRDLPLGEVSAALEQLDGVAAVVPPQEVQLDHPRSGELIALAEPDSWFAYPFWLDDARAPDYARTVDIHRKPGYDPCELFCTSRLRAGLRLIQKKLRFRYRFDVVPLAPERIRGSHGLRVEGDHGPLVIGPGEPPAEMTGFRQYLVGLLNGKQA